MNTFLHPSLLLSKSKITTGFSRLFLSRRLSKRKLQLTSFTRLPSSLLLNNSETQGKVWGLRHSWSDHLELTRIDKFWSNEPEKGKSRQKVCLSFSACFASPAQDAFLVASRMFICSPSSFSFFFGTWEAFLIKSYRTFQARSRDHWPTEWTQHMGIRVLSHVTILEVNYCVDDEWSCSFLLSF